MNRLIRVTLAVLLGLASALLGATPGWAHGKQMRLAITADAQGRLEVAGTWVDDNHPVTDGIAAVVTASATDGRMSGPDYLTAVAGRPGVLVAAAALPTGVWDVAVEAGSPVAAYAQARVESVPGQPVAVFQQRTVEAAVPPGDRAGLDWGPYAVGAIIALLVGGGVVYKVRAARK
ncbi:hypothetical protein R8Z50_20405 [Longispora sp. K20-0274]|uniref:hypothetical protein n=1 Tax=Longispora sp. K20-0274 TaxID=3088255 RepID=UPI0039997207